MQHDPVLQATDAGELHQAGRFETASRAMAISNDTVFRATDSGIECCNTAGAGARQAQQVLRCKSSSWLRRRRSLCPLATVTQGSCHVAGLSLPAKV